MLRLQLSIHHQCTWPACCLASGGAAGWVQIQPGLSERRWEKPMGFTWTLPSTGAAPGWAPGSWVPRKPPILGCSWLPGASELKPWSLEQQASATAACHIHALLSSVSRHRTTRGEYQSRSQARTHRREGWSRVFRLLPSDQPCLPHQCRHLEGARCWGP